MRHSKLLTLFASVVLLSGCGTLMEGQTQNVTLKTPGTEHAKCTIDNGVRYPIETNQTISIMRSGHNMKVDCYGVGNRHETLIVESGFNNWSAANVANAIVPGMTYDHLSNGLYDYPPTIVVSFAQTGGKGFETPDYHNLEAPNPYTQPIENYGPSTPRIEHDGEYMKRGTKKVDPVSYNPFESDSSTSSSTSSQGMMMDNVNGGTSSKTPAPVLKGGTAESLTRSANPGVFQNK